MNSSGDTTVPRPHTPERVASPDDLREPQAFGGWLRTIVRTECSRIARRTRLVTVPIDTAFAERPEPSTGDTRHWELRQHLLKAINALPESDRDVESAISLPRQLAA